MWVLYLLSWFGIIVQMSFLLIAIASGLYYLAEIVEENTEITKKVIRWLSIFVLLVYTAILLFEDLPFILVLCGMLSQIVHLVILLDFPYITINSFSFISAILLFIINHYLAFGFFSGIFMPFYEGILLFSTSLFSCWRHFGTIIDHLFYPYILHKKNKNSNSSLWICTNIKIYHFSVFK
nr:protein TEX261 isoform X2 [Halyomorpha halys]